MKNSKKGISLIVLIITIIVIIILATAILVSVINNNPISEANKARYESDRDNMQAVFTNTVGKIMAENQGVVNVTAGQINTVTTGVKETTGEVAYTVDNATVAANSSGTIKFDKETNNATTYYTGKKLPIYAAGETNWYVDSEGVLTLEVAGVKYGSGAVEELTYTSLGNWEHQLSDGIIEAHDTESGICSKCGENVLAPGYYYENGNFISWNELIEQKFFNTTCSTCGGTYFKSDGAIKMVQDPSCKNLSVSNCFCGQHTIEFEEIILSPSITTVKATEICNIHRIKILYIPRTIKRIDNSNAISDIAGPTDKLVYCGTKEQFLKVDCGTDWFDCWDIYCVDGSLFMNQDGTVYMN